MNDSVQNNPLGTGSRVFPIPKVGISEKRITVSRGLNRVPRHLKVTPTMVDDFIIDPVMAAYYILGEKLDVFQACRLKLFWWTPNVIDSSGFGTGKSRIIWIFMNLRCILIGDQHVCTYFQTFQAAKDIYWPYYKTFDSRRAPIFAAQLGKLDADGDIDGKDNTLGPACYKQYFKNDSLQYCPAPNWFQDAKGQAGQTFNVVAMDEWTKVETMTKKKGAVTNEKGDAVGGINQQIIGRVRRASWNQFHPLWGNHRLYLATAESVNHPAYRRYRNFLRLVAAGDPNYAVFSACFKDFSNLPLEEDIRCEDVRDERGNVTGREWKSTRGKPFKVVIPDWTTIKDLNEQLTRAHFLREGCGIWARETKGWYSEDALERCVATGLQNNLQPETSRANHLGEVYYFMGYDPAPAQNKTSDDAGMVILRARPRPGLGAPPTSALGDWICEYVWAMRMRGEVKRGGAPEGTIFASTTSQMSGAVHTRHRRFALTGILMDPSGGGNLVWPELNKERQMIDGVDTICTPIARAEDISVTNAIFILNLFLRRDKGVVQMWPILAGDDNLIDAAHVVFQEAVEHAIVSFPIPFNERPGDTTKDWDAEKRWALINLDEARRQLMNIQVATRDDGSWDLTKNGARQFSAVGKKDLGYAAMFAYVRFRIWLASGDLDFNRENEEETGCYGV